MLDGLPEAIKQHLEALLALENRVVEAHERARSREVDAVGEHERMELEESLRRLAALACTARLTHKRRRRRARARSTPAARCARNMRYDGVPFRAGHGPPRRGQAAAGGARATSRCRCAATARFTLHLVHGLQSLFGQVRTFAFVADLAEITDLFADHPVEQRARVLVLRRRACSTSTPTPTTAPRSARSSRTSARPSPAARRCSSSATAAATATTRNLPAFEEITRRARETIWLTPEPRYSWGLGACDLPAYAEYCDRVRVVRDLTGLESAAKDLATELVGR